MLLAKLENTVASPIPQKSVRTAIARAEKYQTNKQ